jgi:hypothetical protein
MAISLGDSEVRAVRRSWIVWAGALVATIGLSACGGGGGSAPSSGGPPSSGGNPPAGGSPPPGGTGGAGTGTIRVKVTDVFGDAVAGAQVSWLGNTRTVTLQTGPDGRVQFDDVPTGAARVCADYRTRGHTCGAPDSVNVERGMLLELSRQLQPYGDPVAAVLSTTVDSGGVSGDGRSLDVTLRVAVTEAQPGRSWFDNGVATYSGVEVLNCPARAGDELVELGPRCIQGTDGSDRSYSFGQVVDLGMVREIERPALPSAVGLLIDQSDAGLSPDLAPNDSRLFAAKVFADALLPDTRLALAGFASDEPSGSSSRLPQRPVTFFPVESPGFLTSRSQAFEVLHDLSGLVGGGAPLYDAVAAALDFMAARTPHDLQRALVVLADGADSTCGTPARCAERRRGIARQARDAGIRIFFVAVDVEGDCQDPTWNHCIEFRARDHMRLLAREAGSPLAVGPGSFHSPLVLARQWLSGPMMVQDIRVRLTSDTPGAFAPGAVVMGELSGVNPSQCPMDCWVHLLPFRVEIPR